MNKKPKNSTSNSIIAVNKKARFDYSIEKTFEAGLILQGWEVKSLRAKKIQIRDSYITFEKNSAKAIGLLINPLQSASTHIQVTPSRSRLILLHKKEIDTLRGLVERKGMTIVVLSIYWKKNHIKLELGVGKGKKLYDKRAAEKAKDWAREKNRLVKLNRTNL